MDFPALAPTKATRNLALSSSFSFHYLVGLTFNTVREGSEVISIILLLKACTIVSIGHVDLKLCRLFACSLLFCSLLGEDFKHY